MRILGPAALLVLGLFLVSEGFGQFPPPPAPRNQGPLVPAPPVSQPIDLPTALRLATTSNLDIAQARASVAQAQAAMQRAYSRVLPTITGSAVYVDHDGRIQQANGNILNVNRTSLAVGGTTGLSYDIADAIFLPLAARQAERAVEAGSVRVTNDTFLAVADAYVAVLRAQRRLARVDMTILFLTDEKPVPDRAGSKGLYPLVRDVVEAGGKDAHRSDLARLQVEIARRREERAVIFQDLQVASAELARLLRLDPKILLTPVEDRWAAVNLPGIEYLDRDITDLVQFALSNRPEIAEQASLVQFARAREKGAHYRPFLPQVQMLYFAGGFGGGPVRDTSAKIIDPVSGSIDKPITPTGDIERFGHRSDLSIGLGWQLQGLGFGNRAEWRETRAAEAHARFRLLQAHDRVQAQVVQARAAVVQSSDRIWTIWDALSGKDGKAVGPVFESVRLNFARIRGAEGRPLEALDSLRGLNDTLEAYANGLSDFDRARFRLLVVLGIPGSAILDACRPGGSIPLTGLSAPAAPGPEAAPAPASGPVPAPAPAPLPAPAPVGMVPLPGGNFEPR